MTGPCNAEGCDCGHTIEQLRQRKEKLWLVLEAFVTAAKIERLELNSVAWRELLAEGKATLANTKETT